MGRLHGDVGAGPPRGLDAIAGLQVSSTPTLGLGLGLGLGLAENTNNPFLG
ncbi:hypothetical protein [Streptomyces atratus]|uniref:hypothetical protein n=1 Tax=Streptomyces atratus TaxID=1893 RepID=UPI0021A72476|nr:hypothetical protein [Streptomyces atratus]MCT2544518.1 hypothetical protein [Streptomyces atratus]